jgi:glycosyltransferase involved in cell wall biosynthesis
LRAIMDERIRVLQLGDRISLLGALSSPQLANAMISSELLLISSRFEGMPITALEAQACGLPVVSTRTGEIGCVIQDQITGRIVAESDPHRLAEAIREILQSPQNYRAVTCARLVAEYRCSRVLETFYNQVRELVHSI